VAEVFKHFRYPHRKAVSMLQSVCFSFLKNNNNRPFSPFFEVVRFRWILGYDFNKISQSS
jgi:hypothetical protein